MSNTEKKTFQHQHDYFEFIDTVHDHVKIEDFGEYVKLSDEWYNLATQTDFILNIGKEITDPAVLESLEKTYTRINGIKKELMKIKRR